MSMLEAGLRGGTVTILLLVAMLFLRDSGRTPAGRNSALFFLSAVAYVICSAPGGASLDTPLGLLLLAVSHGHPALFWIWAAATFDDAFKPSWWRGVGWLCADATLEHPVGHAGRGQLVGGSRLGRLVRGRWSPDSQRLRAARSGSHPWLEGQESGSSSKRFRLRGSSLLAVWSGWTARAEAIPQ